MSDVASVVTCILALIASIILAVLFLPLKKRDQLSGFGAWLNDLFNFRTLVIEKILKYLYILSTCICVIGSLVMMISAAIADYGGAEMLLNGLLTLVLGPIVVRLAYELLMMFVLLVTNVMEINRKLKGQPCEEPAPEQPAPVIQQSAPVCQAPVEPKYMFCTQCGTKYDVNQGNCPNCGKQ